MDKTVFPLSAPSIEDGAITVDLMLKEPTRIDNYVSRLVEKDLLSTLIFNSVTVSGGALLFDQLTENRDRAKNKPGVVAPGGEFPVIWTAEGEPRIETVLKTGGKYAITDEAVKRNDATGLMRKSRQVANSMRLDLDGRAMDALDAALDGIDGTLIIESENWEKALEVTKSNKTAKTGEGAVLTDIANAQYAVEDLGLGYSLDTLILHPKDALNLKLLLGVTEWATALTTLGLTPHVSKAATQGSPIALMSRVVGSIGVESPISTEAWREPETQQHWTQTWATVGYGITDPFAMVRLEGVGAAAPSGEGESGNG